MKHLVLLLLFTTTCLVAQVKTKFPITTYSVNDGLAQSVIYSLFQDRDGYLWLGTKAGVSCFDGRTFKNYDSSHGLSHNTVRDIIQTPDGNIWFATEGGISIFDGTTFRELKGKDSTSPRSTRQILHTKDGTLWGASFEQGVFRYRDNNFDYFSDQQEIHGKPARVILQDNQGRIWVGFFGEGLAFWQNGQWQKIPTKPEHRYIRALYEIGDGGMLLGTSAGLYTISGDRHIERFSLDPRLQNTITAITRGALGTLWIGTNQYGAVRIQGSQIQSFNIDNGMSNNGIQSILLDNEQKMWFGTFGGGVCRLGRTQFINITAQTGFDYDNVYALYQDTEGGIWIGTNGGGLTLLKDDKFTHFDQSDGLLDDKILSINQDQQGRLWVGTLGGVNYFDGNQIKSLTTQQGLPHNITFHISPLRDGRIMLGTLAGLGIFDDGKLISLTKDDGLIHNRIHHILERRNGEIWLATIQGISVYSKGRIDRSYTIADGMQSDYLNYLHEDATGRLWIASSEGLMCLDENGFRYYSTKDGLSSPLCNVIVEDQEGMIWVGTANGLNRFNGESFSIFSHRDGLPSNEINRNAGLRDNRGNLWFGTTAGATRFRSADPAGKLQPPFINITEFLVMGQPRSLKITESLNAWENFIEVYFNGISFSDSENIRFSYRLKGLDDQWSSTTATHASFLNLPPGQYCFSVRARNSEGLWSKQPAEIHFQVKPPFWREAWFFSVATILLIGLVLFQFWRLKNKNIRLEKMVSARTQELKQLALWDQLTGARNRHYLDLIMPSELAKLKRDFYAASRGYANKAHSLGIAMLDIDYFKTINDTFGHEIGDLALAKLADRLKEFIRESDTLVRWGGEEFLLILPRIDFQHLEHLCDRLRRNVEKDPLELHTNKNIILQISIGFTIFPLDHDPMDYEWRKLINLADIALYEAKRRGRNMSIGFNPEGYLLEALFKMAETRADGIPDYMAQGFSIHPAHPQKNF